MQSKDQSPGTISEFAGHRASEDHTGLVGNGAAIPAVKSTKLLPRRSKRRRQRASENQKIITAASPASREVQTIVKSPGTNSTFADHHESEDQVVGVGNGAATGALKSNEKTPRRSKRRRHRGFENQKKPTTAASPATVDMQSKFALPGTISDGGQVGSDIQCKSASVDGRASASLKSKRPLPGQLLRDGHCGLENHASDAVVGDDHFSGENQAAVVIATIRELWRRRQAWHRAEKSLTLQCKAICRRFVGGDKDEANKLFAALEGQASAEDQNHRAAGVAILPLLMARETINQHREAVEKILDVLARELPIFDWTKGIRGLGALSLAALIGECGDIGSYKSVSALWKRMGLAPFTFDGTSKALSTWRKEGGLSAAEWKEAGYSPRRCSIAYNIGVSLMRAQRAEDPYRLIYDHEKAKQLDRGLTPKHAHNRACRYMTKRFLAQFYGAWKRVSVA